MSRLKVLQDPCRTGDTEARFGQAYLVAAFCPARGRGDVEVATAHSFLDSGINIVLLCPPCAEVSGS
jgi:hypothetical protein